MNISSEVVIVHDYLTQRGGAERVVLSILKAFPSAPLFTSLYDPEGTFPDFKDKDVRELIPGAARFLRRHHRFALPMLPHLFASLSIDAKMVICSSSGWAHGVKAGGFKLVYCYTPARWLYQRDRYLDKSQVLHRVLLKSLHPYLLAWDRKAARSAGMYVAISTAVQGRIKDAYGIEAALLHPPQSLRISGPTVAIPGVVPGFFLTVSRLLPYKNLDALLGAFSSLPSERLLILGSGPQEGPLRGLAPKNVKFLGSLSDAHLRWLYTNCTAVIACSYEDFGLTPLEGASFGKPALVLRWGGYLDTVAEFETGIFFDTPTPADIAGAVSKFRRMEFDKEAISKYASAFSEEEFVSGLTQLAAGILSAPRT